MDARELILPEDRDRELLAEEGGNMLLLEIDVEAGLRTSAIEESSSARSGLFEYRPFPTTSTSSVLLFFVEKLILEFILLTSCCPPAPAPLLPLTKPNFSSNISLRSEVRRMLRSSRLRYGREAVSIELIEL